MSFLKRLLTKKPDLVVEDSEPAKQEVQEDVEQLKDDARNLSLADVEKEIDKITEKDALITARKKTDETPIKQALNETSEKPLYHIKKHNKGWQIIAEGSERAHRVLPTQKEAIDFAKEHDLDYLLYRVDGTLRQ